MNRDYPVALASAIQKGFWDLLPGKNPQRVYVLEAEFSRRRHDGTKILKNQFPVNY